MANKARMVSTEISEDAHKVLRLFRVEDGLTVRAVIEMALKRLGEERPSRDEAPTLSIEAV